MGSKFGMQRRAAQSSMVPGVQDLQSLLEPVQAIPAGGQAGESACPTGHAEGTEHRHAQG